jgi:cytochrome c oxidase subunit 4
MDLMDPRVLHKEHKHPGPVLYIKIAVVLFVLTALEVLAYEMARRSDLPGVFVKAVGALLVPILVVLSAVKFALVAGFYMHLKQDAKIYTGIFVFPLILAVALTLALVLLFAVTHLMVQGP